NDLCFAFKACDEGWVSLQVSTHDLDGNKALQVRVEGLPHFGHAATAQALLQFIFAESACSCTHTNSSSQRILEYSDFTTVGAVDVLAHHADNYWCDLRHCAKRY